MRWIVALHVIFVVVWFSGLFYLPRLYVYHAMCDDEPGKERFKVMERKLYVMTNIGAIGTAIFGIWLLVAYAYSSYSHTIWLWIKLVFVVLLYAYHGFLGKILKQFRAGVDVRGHKYYRIINEVPVIPLFVIIIMVIVKPF